MSAALAEQRVAQALVAILDTAAAVAALTGAASGNLRPVDDAAPAPARGLAYDLGPTTLREGIGEAWDVACTLTAEAETRARVRSLLAAAEDALTVAAFDAAGVDAMVTESEAGGVVRGQYADSRDAPRPRETYAGELDLTIWITL